MELGALFRSSRLLRTPKWNKDKKRLEIHEEQAHFVRETFRLRGAGLSFYKMAKELGKNSHTVERWTQVPYYKGESWTISLSPGEGHDPETFSYECPALVDTEAWQKARRVTSLHNGRVNPYGLLKRIFHQHPDGTLVPMRGQSYGKKDGGRRYRCKDGWGKNCPGTGLLNGGSRVQTSLRAEEVEGAVINWIIQLTTDPDSYEKAVLDATEAAEAFNIEPDTRDLERHMAAAQRKIYRLIGLYSDGIMEKNELYEKLKAPQAQLAQYEELRTIALEQHTDAPQAPLTIDALFAMTIAEGEDWASEIEPERGSAQWLDEFHRASHAETLPTWAIEELRVLAHALEIKVIVERGDDEKPKYHL